MVSGKNEDYPETMTISASPDSIISEEMENRLGVYQRTNSTRNGRPEWEQVANQKNWLKNMFFANLLGKKLRLC